MVQSKVQILIVDDEWNLRNLLGIYLNKPKYQITEAQNGKEALSFIRQQPFDLIILDIMMPDMDGWEVCSKIRETKQTPILMLTARTDTKDKVHGLKIGADDYLVKPFAPEELVARVEALLRRSKHDDAEEEDLFIVYEELTIDPDGRRVFVGEQPIVFTPKEFDLLHFLAINLKRVLTREILLDRIWGEDYLQDDRTVDTHIKNIREKVRKAGLSFNPIKTVWGVGYQFQSPEVSS
jgi:two-component system response regulator ResD